MTSESQAAIPAMFTKIIVDDEEKMASYYSEVYGLKVTHRVSGEAGGLGEPFREVMLATSDGSNQSLVMFKFVDRPAPRDQQIIAGFVTDDIESLSRAIVSAGGKLCGDINDMPEHGVRVLFSEDPEGALCENVQVIQ